MPTRATRRRRVNIAARALPFSLIRLDFSAAKSVAVSCSVMAWETDDVDS